MRSEQLVATRAKLYTQVRAKRELVKKGISRHFSDVSFLTSINRRILSQSEKKVQYFQKSSLRLRVNSLALASKIQYNVSQVFIRSFL